MVCDYFFWLLLAEWFGLGVAPPGLCGLLALSAHGDMVHYFVMALVSGSRCRCVWVLPVGTNGFPGDARDAMLGSTVDTCSAPASRGSLTNFKYVPRCGGLVFCSIVSVLTQNGEVCPADAPVHGLFRAAHTEKSGHYFHKKARAGGGVRDAVHGEVPEALLSQEPGTQPTLDDDGSGAPGLTASTRSGRRSGSSGAPWSSLSTARWSCRLSMLLCR